MHPLTDAKGLKMVIEEQGHKVANIWNIKHRMTKKPLPMFFIDLEPNQNNKTVYNINKLLQCKVISEAPKPKRDISNVPTIKGMVTPKSIASTNLDA